MYRTRTGRWIAGAYNNLATTVAGLVTVLQTEAAAGATAAREATVVATAATEAVVVIAADVGVAAEGAPVAAAAPGRQVATVMGPTRLTHRGGRQGAVIALTVTTAARGRRAREETRIRLNRPGGRETKEETSRGRVVDGKGARGRPKASSRRLWASRTPAGDQPRAINRRRSGRVTI